jgi:hypothetical protein
VRERIRSIFNISENTHEMEEQLVAIPATSESSNLDRQAQSGYTELIGGSVPCPSCQGSGFIPKGIFVVVYL